MKDRVKQFLQNKEKMKVKKNCIKCKKIFTAVNKFHFLCDACKKLNKEYGRFAGTIIKSVDKYS